jgi:seryl-tRNA synthetase
MLDRCFILQNLDAVRANAKPQRQRPHARAGRHKGHATQAQIERGRQLKAQRAGVDTQLRTTEQDLAELQLAIPNMTQPVAPIGLSDQDNVGSREARPRSASPPLMFLCVTAVTSAPISRTPRRLGIRACAWSRTSIPLLAVKLANDRPGAVAWGPTSWTAAPSLGP